jgi:hypothetical protein
MVNSYYLFSLILTYLFLYLPYWFIRDGYVVSVVCPILRDMFYHSMVFDLCQL